MNIRNQRPVVAFLAAIFALLSIFSSLAQAADVTSLQLVSSVRSGRTSFDYTYRINVHNGAAALAAAQATVLSNAPGTTVLDSLVTLGDLGANTTTLSTDTFTIRQDRTAAFNPASLVWTVTGVSAPTPTSLEVILSDPFVAPDGSVTVSPIVRDANGQPMDMANAQFSLSVVPVGTVVGNAPVVEGMTVRFPKLVKSLINQDVSVDPDGEFADTDPSDPNYGKETGGTYRISLSLVGSSLSGSKSLTVLPTGTAGITYKANQYAGQMGNAFALAKQAIANNDPSLLAQARAAFQAVKSNTDFSQAVLGTTNAIAPADGYSVTLVQLSAHGIVAGPQDAQYAAALTNVLQRIRDAKAKVLAFNAAAMDQQSLDAMTNSVLAYKQALQALQALKLSTYGTVQLQAEINQQIGTELPQLLDAIKSKSGELLSLVTLAGGPAPIFATLDLVGPGAAIPGLNGPSPMEMYASTKPVQFSMYFTFWSTAFSAFTDLSNAARTNIWELSISLANTLLNVMTAEIINQGNPGTFFIDYVYASSSTAAMCPNYRPTRIIGTRFGADANAFRVAVIGCVQSDVLAKVITLSVPSNPAAYIRLFNKVISITTSLANAGGVAAVSTPDYIAYDDIGFDEEMLYFANGWPRVNQSRLPCSGLVIVMDLAKGGMQAFNPLALPSCG